MLRPLAGVLLLALLWGLFTQRRTRPYDKPPVEPPAPRRKLRRYE